MSTRLASVLLVAVALLACDRDDKPETKTDAPPANVDEAAAAKYGLTPEQASKPLAKVGDVVITVGDFAEQLGGQSPYLRARYQSPERRREFLDNMIRFELLAIEAQKEGFSESAPVERVRKQMMVQRMMAELFETDGIKLSDITDEEIKAYYEAHHDDFHKPAQVRASHIVVKQKALAEKLLKQLQDGERNMQLFRELAKKHNIDAETRDRMGDLRFFGEKAGTDPSESPMAPEVRAAAFTLQNVGDLHPEVIQSEQGFHVLRLTGKRAELNRSLDDARRLIQNRLWRDKREAAIEAFVEDLRKKASIEEDLSMLEKVKLSPAAGEQADGAETGDTAPDGEQTPTESPSKDDGPDAAQDAPPPAE